MKETLKIEELLQRLDNSLQQLSTAQQAAKQTFFSERFYTDKELSDRIKISRRTLQEWRNSGIIDFIHIGGKIIYKESDILKALDSHYIKSFLE